MQLKNSKFYTLEVCWLLVIHLLSKSEAFLYLLKFSVMVVLSFTPVHGSFVEMTLHSLTTSGGIHKRRVVPRKVRLRVRYILFSIEDALGKGMRGWVTHFYAG